jgi:glucose-6-phosphate-specific signal transduction histidine kinase
MNWETFILIFIIFAIGVVIYALFNSAKYYQKRYDESKIVEPRILRMILCFLMAMLYALVALSGVDPLKGLEK